MEDPVTKKRNPAHAANSLSLSVPSYIGLPLGPSLSITDFCESRRHHRLEWKTEVGEGGRKGGEDIAITL